MFRCEHVHLLSRLDVYICPIKITLSVETGCVTLAIVQWYNCSVTFFIENETENPEKRLEPN